MDSLEQAGLTRTIGASNEIDSWIKIECYTLEISEICQAQLTDGHIARAAIYNRIGITTYKLDESSLSLIIQLLLASLSLISTSSEWRTLRTSIR